jgi:hypothetical protein
MASTPTPKGPADARQIFEAEAARRGIIWVRGVGRIDSEPRAVIVHLTGVPTDNQIRALDQFLTDWETTAL